MINQNELRERTQEFLKDLNLPISRFAKTIGFDRGSYYRWVKGDFDFGVDKVEKIDRHLKRFGY